MVATGLPHTMTWLPVSLVGLSRMGFMSARGSMPAASACMAWARPISRPSRVMAELRAMFCDLNGATRRPSCASTRQRPATKRLLPAPDMVPCTIKDFAVMRAPPPEPR